MIKNKIGKNAGIIWHYLNSSASRRCSYGELRSALQLSDRELNLSLGWLARESQIYFDEQAENISLPPCPYF
ncbi:MAG: winged helix-turn-helix domain-containing protein [Prevotella sp.]|nr:winged helix-turn-helix domain-containing protein [Prevotella sp.]